MNSMSRLISVCVYQPTKGGVWYMKWRDAGGEQHNKSTRSRDKVVARRLARHLEQEIALSPLGLAPAPLDVKRTWSQTVAEFCSVQQKSSEETVKSYQRCAAAFTKAIGDPALVNVSKVTLDSHVSKRLENQIARSTVNKELRHFRAILRWAHARGFIRQLPSFKGVFVREDERAPIRIPEATFSALLAALKEPSLALRKQSPSWWTVFLRLLHWTGCRSGELLKLRWKSINFKKQTVTVLAETSKGRRDKEIPFRETLAKELLAWKAACGSSNDDDLVLPWSGDRKPLYAEFKKIEKAAGVAHHQFKNYRSSRACALVDQGESTLAVKDWMGHSSVVTTEKFYANGRNRLSTAATNLEAAEFGTPRDTTETSVRIKTP